MGFLWAIVTGLIFMLFFKMGGWGLLLGFILGPILYRAFNNIAPMRNTQANPMLFLSVTFEVLGHLSKAKGVVTADDIRLATQLMDQLNLQGDARHQAQEAFNLGKGGDYPLRTRLQELYASYRYQKKVLNIFCEQLIRAAISDGHLHEKEQQILFIVAEEFHISRAQMSLYIQMMMGSYHFQRGGYEQASSGQGRRSQSQQGYSYSQSGYHQGPYTNPAANLNEAYRILGVQSQDDAATIKRAYRKLMNEHHPDKLVSKGLPKEMLEAAKQRAQEIQAAYDLIKSQRGFK